MAPNSGPTTIAPITRIEESVTTAIAARMTASSRNRWKLTVGTAPAWACDSTESQMTASSGWPGASSSIRRASRNGVLVGLVTTMDPRSSTPSSSSRSRTSPACSRATSHSSRSPSGLTTAPCW